MAQYQQGGAVAPAPVLELIKQPIYDTVAIVTAATTTSFFAIPIGGADAGALVGVKTYSETNLRRAGALATPQQFDIYAITVKYVSSITNADLDQFLLRSNLDVTIGQKSYLRVRNTVLPADTTKVVDALAAAADAVHPGWPITSNVFDTSIPEELFDPVTGRTFLTGRRVPIHVPSEQQFPVTMEHVGGLTLQATRRTEVVWWGILKREVQ